MELKERAGRRVKQYRLAHGLTQAALGSLLGMSGPALYGIEAGRNLSLERAVQIAALLGCTVDDLLREEPEHAA